MNPIRCDHYERQGAIDVQRGILEPHCEDCAELAQADMRMHQKLRDLALEEGDPAWKERVRASVGRKRTAQKSHRRVVASVSMLAAVAALSLVYLRPGDDESFGTPQIVLETVHSARSRNMRGRAIQRGDVVRWSVRMPASYFAELRIYDSTGRLVAHTKKSDAQPFSLELDAQVEIGKYTALALWSSQPFELAQADLDATQRAVEEHPKIELDWQTFTAR